MTLSAPYSGLSELPSLQPKFQTLPYDSEWPTTPMKRMEEGQIAAGIDIVIGQTKDEGTLFTKLAFMFSSTADIIFFKNMMYAALKEGNNATTSALMQYYVDLAEETSVWDAQVQFCGDIMFSIPVHLSLSKIAKNKKSSNPDTSTNPSNLHSYMFSYVPEGK